MKPVVMLAALSLCLGLAGWVYMKIAKIAKQLPLSCVDFHGVRTDTVEVQTGLRFDEEGRLTDRLEVKVPLWRSNGLKEKPREGVPPQR